MAVPDGLDALTVQTIHDRVDLGATIRKSDVIAVYGTVDAGMLGE